VFFCIDGKPVPAVELVLITVEPEYKVDDYSVRLGGNRTLSSVRVPKLDTSRICVGLKGPTELCSQLLDIHKGLTARINADESGETEDQQTPGNE
jgi:hypothetical protein